MVVFLRLHQYIMDNEENNCVQHSEKWKKLNKNIIKGGLRIKTKRKKNKMKKIKKSRKNNK